MIPARLLFLLILFLEFVDEVEVDGVGLLVFVKGDDCLLLCVLLWLGGFLLGWFWQEVLREVACDAGDLVDGVLA